MFVYLKICYSVVIFYRDDFIFIERTSKIDCWKMMCRNRERFEVFLLKYYIIVVVCDTRRKYCLVSPAAMTYTIHTYVILYLSRSVTDGAPC